MENRKRRKSKSRKKRSGKSRFSLGYLIGALILIAVVFLTVIIVRGCSGMKYRSPEKVVETMVKYATEGKTKKVLSCYGATMKTASENLKKEVDATISYYKAHNMTKVSIQDCGIISENDNYTYVYITYNLVLEDEQEFPCIGTYMTKAIEGKYQVFSAEEITDEMREEAANQYVKFMTTNAYKNYAKAYDTFTKKNPGYENRIAGNIK